MSKLIICFINYCFQCVPSTTELEQYPHFKDLITISIQNEELNLASHSKINHASSKADVLNEATARKSIIREERSQSVASKKEKESDTKGRVTPPILNNRGSRTSRILTWLDFTKSCRKQNSDS